MNEGARPKIEVVRLPSTERAKISTLVDGGVQIKAEFQHHLTGNYASCSHLEDTNKNCCKYQRHVVPYRKPHFRGNAASLATKSCDNIFARQHVCASVGRLEYDNSCVWRDSTRSEEYLFRSSSCNQSPVLQTSPRNARSRILAFLKKLSPIPRRSKAQTEYNSFPWVVVEFSQKHFNNDKEPSKRNSTDSAASDHSFILALKESELRKELAVPKTRKYIKKNNTKCSATTPQIYIASPVTSCSVSPVSLVNSMPSITSQNIAVRTTARQRAAGGETPATAAVKLASPVRPHTLHLPASEQPSNARNLTPDFGAHPSMASCESIGSCSLDVDATISDASEFIEEKSISERTLHSVPLSSSKTPDRDNIRPSYLPYSTLSSPGTVGQSTPEYVKKTARRFESSSPVEINGAGSPRNITYTKFAENTKTVPGFVISETSSQEDKVFNGTVFPAKKPSYLGLSCSISGYSGITTYDSKLREGFRSRDHSPGRLGIIRSREVSPSRYGTDQTDTLALSNSCFTSECGNFLLPGPRSTDMYKISPNSMNGMKADGNIITNGCVNGFSNMSDENTLIMNGKDRKFATMNGNHVTNGSLDSARETHSIVYSDYSSKGKSVLCESHSEVSSTIKESSRYFLSSMLNSESVCETVSPKNSVYNHSSVSESILTRSPLTITSKKYEIHESASNSSKCSPESPKTGSKDSINAPNLSPHKHSPGTVRVVEFTSQEKSYVHSTSLRSSVFSGDSVDISSASQSTRSSTGHSETLTTQSYSVNQLGSSVSDGNVCKSFILQRVERLYGPGALAQGFFKRTVNRPKEKEENEGYFMNNRGNDKDEDSKMTQTAIRVTESSPALPVLRHLRPEFRAQLAVARPIRRFTDKETIGQQQVFSEAAESPRPQIEIPVLQQQVSVESLPESLPDLQPAAPEVVLPIDQSQVSSGEPNHTTNGEASHLSQEKEGHHFLILLKKETDRLNELAAQAETDLANISNLSEEILGKLRAASGQARLLMKQKLQQFEGLCHKNINQNPDEQFPTTREDLAGFWDMVCLQIDHVDSLFKEIDHLRNNNWQEEKPVSKDTVSSSGKRRSTSTRKTSTKTSTANEELRKARDDARRKMMEEKRKAMREKFAEPKNDSVEIYVPQENGK